MKAVLMSIQPKWCELIASGKKTVEVRKTKPKLDVPFKVYIYCTKAKDHFSIGGGIYATSDTLYRLPTGEIKFGDGFELMGDWSGQYDESNFLNGKVIGEFVCDFVDEYKYDYCPHPEIGMDYDCGDNWWEIADEDLENACLTYDEFKKYVWGYREVYGWHISNLVIYDKPRELGEFLKATNVFPTLIHDIAEEGNGPRYNKFYYPLKRPPQSWCYVERSESLNTLLLREENARLRGNDAT